MAGSAGHRPRRRCRPAPACRNWEIGANCRPSLSLSGDCQGRIPFSTSEDCIRGTPVAVGFRVFFGGPKVGVDVVSRFRNLPVANVSDAMNRMSAGGAALRPMHAGGGLAGPAVTVKTRPGDNLMMHKAF